MHIIRLRGPWQLEPLECYVRRSEGGYSSQSESLPAGGRRTMPADWCESIGRDFLGVVRYHRTFNRPTNLEPHERVWLVVEPPRSRGFVHFNGESLGHVRYGSSPGRFDITQLLKEHNAVAIDVGHPELDDAGDAPNDGGPLAPGGLVGEVRLEIEG